MAQLVAFEVGEAAPPQGKCAKGVAKRTGGYRGAHGTNFGPKGLGFAEPRTNFRQCVEEIWIAFGHCFDAFNFDGGASEAQNSGGHDHPVVTSAVERGGFYGARANGEGVFLGVEFNLNPGFCKLFLKGGSAVAFLVL